MAGLMTGLTRRIKGLERYWYTKNAVAVTLLPLSWLFRSVVVFRRALYRWRNRAGPRLPAPVIVVGNISVGGTGKTPLVIWLAELLKSQGYSPGVVSRGYGGKAKAWPQLVDGDSDPYRVGDEPVVIARRTGRPVAVAPWRIEAARFLLDEHGCDVLISDDGLQHYALIRDIEIAVVDNERELGNGWCLPAGPLREPISRLCEVDFIVTRGATETASYAMALSGNDAVNLQNPGIRRVLESFANEHLHAVAGIGNPTRFFEMLKARGLDVETHGFPDHHRFTGGDLDFGDARPILMTEKDAVKCRAFAQPHHWYLPVSATLQDGFAQRLLDRLRSRTPVAPGRVVTQIMEPS